MYQDLNTHLVSSGERFKHVCLTLSSHYPDCAGRCSRLGSPQHLFHLKPCTLHDSVIADPVLSTFTNTMCKKILEFYI